MELGHGIQGSKLLVARGGVRIGIVPPLELVTCSHVFSPQLPLNQTCKLSSPNKLDTHTRGHESFFLWAHDWWSFFKERDYHSLASPSSFPQLKKGLAPKGKSATVKRILLP